jgi:hypothetical protein
MTSIESTTYLLSPPVEEHVEVKKTFEKGKFLYIDDSPSKKMHINAWNAISQLELWDYMKKDVFSYMSSKDEEVSMILDKMVELGYDLHSGSSFGWIMRQMEYIAKNGEESYRQLYLKT